MTAGVIYSLDDLPVQQNRVYASAQEAAACPRGKLTLIQGPLTGIVNNASFSPDLIAYDENYQNEQGYSAMFRQHLDQVVAVLRRHFQGRSLLEIGCGKGTFLELLRAQGFSVVGVDPAYEGDAP
jgi:2-polyprenyl-3-methyl-5-hydroxy-6-metoxy-1,4-benzoquinol methylase